MKKQILMILGLLVSSSVFCHEQSKQSIAQLKQDNPLAFSFLPILKSTWIKKVKEKHDGRIPKTDMDWITFSLNPVNMQDNGLGDPTTPFSLSGLQQVLKDSESYTTLTNAKRALRKQYQNDKGTLDLLEEAYQAFLQ